MRRSAIFFGVILLMFLPAVGCESRTAFRPVEGRMRGDKDKDRSESMKEHFVGAPDAQVVDLKPPPPPGQEKKANVDQPRKIKFTADMRVIVDKFDDAAKDLNAAIIAAKGLRAEESITSSPGTPRVGTWRVRVPLDQFDGFREAVAKLGAVERNTLQSEDITAQYYDLQAHIKNRQAARETLRDLLKEVGKKEMKHYLEVWDKLEKMSDEIDRAEGQLRLWANLTDLTTITVSLHEKQKYIPEDKAKKEEDPTFGMRAGKTWHDSWEALLSFGQGVSLVAIAVTPWLPFPLVAGLTLWLLVRRGRVPAVKTVVPVPALPPTQEKEA